MADHRRTYRYQLVHLRTKRSMLGRRQVGSRMFGTALILATAALSLLLLSSCGGSTSATSSTSTTKARSKPRFQVSVTPKTGDVRTVFVFRGRGWRPRRRVEATYGMYCRPEEACELIGFSTAFETDAHGRFTFRLVNGPGPPRGSRPRAAGGGPVTFEQFIRGGSGRLIQRTPPYTVTQDP